MLIGPYFNAAARHDASSRSASQLESRQTSTFGLSSRNSDTEVDTTLTPSRTRCARLRSVAPMGSHCCSLLRYDTLYSEMPVRLPPDTCLTLEGTRSSNLVASACSRRARVPVAAIGTRSGLVASVFPAPRFRQSESTTSECGSQWCPGVATGMPCSPLTLRAITDTRRPASRSRFFNFAESVVATTIHSKAICPAASTQPAVSVFRLRRRQLEIERARVARGGTRNV